MSTARISRFAACLLLSAAGYSAVSAQVTPNYTAKDVGDSYSCEAEGRVTLDDGECSSLPVADGDRGRFPGAGANTPTTSKPRETRLTISGKKVESAVKLLPQLPGQRDMMIEFENNSAELTDQAKANAEQFAIALRDDPRLRRARFAIDGHTNATGSTEYNQELSVRRAQAVVAYMVSHGLDESRFEIVGHGETRPLFMDDPDKAENRRVEARRLDGPAPR